MNYHNDDGSTTGGIITVICIVIAFGFGYWVRDQGVRVQVNIPAIERRAK
ncbi:hypothetical protein ACQ4M3_05265 [Leptolyngbya sp. AN03gr2]